MSAHVQMLKRRAATAAAWRAENPEMENRGWVLIYRAKPCGWTHALDNAKSWCPGVMAVGVGGIDEAVYQATGGNDDAGATEWSAIWNPAPAPALA